MCRLRPTSRASGADAMVTVIAPPGGPPFCGSILERGLNAAAAAAAAAGDRTTKGLKDPFPFPHSTPFEPPLRRKRRLWWRERPKGRRTEFQECFASISDQPADESAHVASVHIT